MYHSPMGRGQWQHPFALLRLAPKAVPNDAACREGGEGDFCCPAFAAPLPVLVGPILLLFECQGAQFSRHEALKPGFSGRLCEREGPVLHRATFCRRDMLREHAMLRVDALRERCDQYPQFLYCCCECIWYWVGWE
jgi:hypothetical protein